MAEPITVTIKNNSGRSLNISWLKGRTYLVPVCKSVVVNYEPWSCATLEQRRVMRNFLQTGGVTLTMHLMTKDGIKDIEYNPALAGDSTSAVKEATETKTQMNTRIASNSQTFAESLGFTAQDVKPATGTVDLLSGAKIEDETADAASLYTADVVTDADETKKNKKNKKS